jgi:hypothetical protein
MIQEAFNRKNEPAITSSQWHVVHARWSGDPNGRPRFVRSIVSEHPDQASAVAAGKSLLASLVTELGDRSDSTRDQILVRKPAYKSLKTARRLVERRDA